MAHSHSPAFLKLVDDTRRHVREFSIEEYRERLARGERWVLVDVREDLEWAASRIPGAVHLSKGVIERDIEARFPDKAEPLVLQCGGGFRSVLVADNLQKMGYTNVISMDGGIRDWREKGFPLTNK
jgi:rhodanese-related sulfurtransferase